MAERPKNGCAGRIKITRDGVVTIVTEHTHAPNHSENEAIKIKVNIRERALTTVETPHQIIQQVTAGVPLDIARSLPEYKSSQRLIERQRKIHGVSYHSVNSLADIEIPNALKQTLRNEDFLLWDSGADDSKRFLMFWTSSNIDLLQEHRHWFIDGTFKVAPSVFLQVFTIHALIDTSAVPLVYFLLPDKDEESYLRILHKLKDLKPSLDPASIMSDFEKASQNACSVVFPRAELVGCFFHLGQSFWRKIQQLNLTAAYGEDENLRTCAKMMLALSFVPVDGVYTAFEDLVDICPPELAPLIDYWRTHILGGNEEADVRH